MRGCQFRIEYKGPKGVFLNLGNGTFADLSSQAGQDTLGAHRGSAYADLNGDSKIDVVVSCLGEPTELRENVSPVGEPLDHPQAGGHAQQSRWHWRPIRIGSRYNQMTSVP
jgi:hypothetical protein